jgi:hypothetical protein
MAGRALTRDGGESTDNLWGCLALSDSVSQSIELVMHRHTHLLKCQRNFRQQGRVDVFIHTQTDFPGRSFSSLELLVKITRAKIREHGLDGLQELSHLRQD